MVLALSYDGKAVCRPLKLSAHTCLESTGIPSDMLMTYARYAALCWDVLSVDIPQTKVLRTGPAHSRKLSKISGKESPCSA